MQHPSLLCFTKTENEKRFSNIFLTRLERSVVLSRSPEAAESHQRGHVVVGAPAAGRLLPSLLVLALPVGLLALLVLAVLLLLQNETSWLKHFTYVHVLKVQAFTEDSKE